MTKVSGGDLSEGQKACLRLVDEHRTSKEIARILGISPFTVDQRLTLARKKLGAATRIEAARIFAEYDGISQPLVYEPQAIDATAAPAIQSAPPNRGERLAQSGFRAMLTAPPIGGERHDLSKKEVLLKGLGIAFYSAVVLTVIAIVLIGALRLFR